MSGKLFELAKKSAKIAVKSMGFEEEITLMTPSRDKEIQIKGLATKHWLNYDTDGSTVNAKNAHICIAEDDLKYLNYPHRNAKGEISLLKHLVTYKDSSGYEKSYVIREHYPNETFGLIVCILNDYRD